MKTISLLSAILVLPAASLLAQGQSEVEVLRARIDVQDRRISQLENAVIRLGGSPIQKTATVQKSTPSKATPSKAIPVVEKSIPVASLSATAEYVVVKGDTLTRIASQHTSTVAAIKKENALKSDGLRIGQKLRIPASSVVATAEKQVSKKVETPKPVASKPVEKSELGAKYKVVAGDTFYGIARRCDMSEAELQAANPKAVPTRLQVGQVLVVSEDVKPAAAKKSTQVAKKAPSKAAVAKSSSPAQSTIKSSSKTAIRTITVHEQMTYGAFANQYGASTSQLNSLNGLNLSKSTMLAKGSELYVPKQY